MLTREENIKLITDYFLRFMNEVELKNSLNFYDINISAESFVAEIFRRVYKLEVVNLNTSTQKNMPAIDLYLPSKNTGIQVTSTAERKKVRDTLSMLASAKLSMPLNRVIIFVLTGRKKFKKDFAAETKNVLTFDKEKDIWDFQNILHAINQMSDDDIAEFCSWLMNSYHSAKLGEYPLPVMIYHKSKQEYDYLYSENNKWNGLHIIENLFPNGYVLPKYYEGYGTRESGEQKPLRKLYSENHTNNLLLIGEGGIGKTTFLAHLMECLFKNKTSNVIPVYIELNRCPAEIGHWVHKRTQKSNFITRYIASMLSGCDLEDVDSELLIQIENELKEAHSDYQYLLLLDGFNEVNHGNALGNTSWTTTIREYLSQEINALGSYTGCRMILTTRRVEGNILPAHMRRIYLSGLKRQNIVDYLKTVGYSPLEIIEIEASSDLMDCLKIPLFLCMFACKNKYEHIKPQRRGEILYYFFHKGTPFYGDHGRFNLVCSFLMDFVIPYIANYMEDVGIFSIRKSDFVEILQNFFEEEQPFWHMDLYVFPTYLKGSKTLTDIKDQIKAMPVSEMINIIVSILSVICCNQKGEYYFIHHHIRDYFSSYYEIQRIRCGVNLFQLGEDTDLCEAALENMYINMWPKGKRRFIGEILGEHRNTPYMDTDGYWHLGNVLFDEQTLLRSLLSFYKNSHLEPGCIISNVLEIYKTVRNSIAGEILDGLDLRNCTLYETVCSIGREDKQLAASFRNCIISDETFFMEGHVGEYRDIALNSYGDEFYTLATDDCIKVWNLDGENCVDTIQISNFINVNYNCGDSLLKISSRGDILLPHYEYFSNDLVDELEDNSNLEQSSLQLMTNDGILEFASPMGSGIASCYGFSSNSKHCLAVWDDSILCIYNISNSSLDNENTDLIQPETTYHLEGIFDEDFEGKILDISMPDEDHIYVAIQAESLNYSSTIQDCGGQILLISPDGTAEFIYEWNSKLSARNNSERIPFDFSYDGKYICLMDHYDILLISLPDLKKEKLFSLKENEVPKQLEFLTRDCSYLGVLAENKFWLYGQEDGIVSYENPILATTLKCCLAGDYILLLDDAMTIFKWKMLHEDTVELVYPTSELSVMGFFDGQRADEVAIEFSNNSIIIIDAKKKVLLDTVYYPIDRMEVDSFSYLPETGLILIILQDDVYEKGILYNLKTGEERSIYMEAKIRNNYVASSYNENFLMISLTHKAFAVDLANGGNFSLSTICEYDKNHEILSFHATDQKAYFLVRPSNEHRLPVYYVYEPSRQSQKILWSNTEVKDPLIMTADALEDMISIEISDYQGHDKKLNRFFYQKQGVFRHYSDDLKQVLSDYGWKPGEFVTAYYLKNTRDHKQDISKYFSEESVEIFGNITKDGLYTITDYEKVTLYHPGLNELMVTDSFTVIDRGMPATIHSVYPFEGHKALCILETEHICYVDTRTGEIEYEMQILPGICVIGCDFSGSIMPEKTSYNLQRHGGIIL